MLSNRRRGLLYWSLVILLALVAAGCSSTDSTGQAEQGSSGEVESNQSTAASTSTTTSTTIPPQPPNVRLPEMAFAVVGQNVSEAIVVTDPNDDEVVIRAFGEDVPGFAPVTNVRGRMIGFEWEPTEAGEWDVEVTATDTGGLVGSAQVQLVAHHEPSVDMFFAMGDSIAAGFGRDRSDFAGTDDCFRSEIDSYGAIAFQSLIEAGALGSRAEFMIVACAAAGSADLATTETSATNIDGEVVGDPISQLERATLLNPTIVTLSIGAGDVGLFDLEEFLRPDAGQDPLAAVDELELDRRVSTVRANLIDTFDVLTSTTSAHIVMTTAYNPVATNPVGIDGCTGECMVAASTRIVDALNAMLIDVASSQREGRVSVARLDGEADSWEAPNGLGIDALRDGLGPLQGLVDNFTGGTSALCADDGGIDDSLISALDCAHPNEDGHREIAEIVAMVLLSI